MEIEVTDEAEPWGEKENHDVGVTGGSGRLSASTSKLHDRARG